MLLKLRFCHASDEHSPVIAAHASDRLQPLQPSPSALTHPLYGRLLLLLGRHLIHPKGSTCINATAGTSVKLLCYISSSTHPLYGRFLLLLCRHLINVPPEPQVLKVHAKHARHVP